MSKKRGTYLVTYIDGNQAVFGNNYKPWYQHAVEHTYGTFKDPEHGWRYSDIADKVVSVKFSDQQFVDDGGLKWATPSGYQEIIDEVNTKESKHYPPYDQIEFDESPGDHSVLTKKLKEY